MSQSVPAPIAPMLATAGPVPAGTGWAFEFKWDGVRAVTAVGAGRVHVISRNHNDVTKTYPELGGLGPMLAGRTAVLDGEVVAIDESGRARFDLLQLRMHVQRPTETLLDQVQVTYVLFDLLYLDGQSLLEAPYRRRRELLDGLELDGRSARIRVPRCVVDVDGRQLLELARAHHLEGVVAKRLTSRYEPGRRSRAWIKTALLNTQEVLIGGWKPGDGRRAGTIGALLLGAYDPAGRLAYLGKVGTGFTDAMLHDLHTRLEPLQRPESPFQTPIPREDVRGVHWTTPALVGEVEYRMVSPDGRLRHAAWRGLRADKSPEQVTSPFFD
jgi:bifunctional non-homologous end joining protein LigD